MTNRVICTTCNRDDATASYPNGIYCFRCQITHWTKQKPEKPFFPDLKPLGTISDEVVLPQSFTQEIPKEGLHWLYKHGITDDLIKDYNIGYVKNEVVRVPGSSFTARLKNRIILPFCIHRMDGPDIIKWYQARALGGEEPKYITIGTKSPYMIRGYLNDDPMVITEDILSAIRISDIKGFKSTALCGTSLSDADLLTFQKTYDTIILWLDNDDAGIKGRNKLAKRFELYGTRVIKIINPKEAKQCFRKELNEILTLALRS